MSSAVPVTVKKDKTWVALVGTTASALAPLLLSIADVLPPEIAAIVAAIGAGLTTLGVYFAKYLPEDAVAVPNEVVTPNPNPDQVYENPWPAPKLEG